MSSYIYILLVYLSLHLCRAFILRPICMHNHNLRHRTSISLNLLPISQLSFDYVTFIQNLRDNDNMRTIIIDVMTVTATYTIGDVTAQVIDNNKQQKMHQLGQQSQQQLQQVALTGSDWYDADRTKRYFLFALGDGLVCHYWFIILDYMISSAFSSSSNVVEMVERIVADRILYTPIWYVYFITCFVLLENRGVRNIIPTIKKDWNSLYLLDMKFYFPLSILVYTVVPDDYRVATFAVGSYVFSTILSMFNANNKAEENLEITKK